MHTMRQTYPTNYQMVDRITPVRRPPAPSGLTGAQKVIVGLMSVGAFVTGTGIGAALATALGFR